MNRVFCIEAIAYVIVVLCSTGNLCTAVALLKCLRLRQQATTAFVVSLCLSDLLFCAVNLPLTASRYIHQAWVLGETLCQLFPFFFYGNVAVSLLSMVAITVNRQVTLPCTVLCYEGETIIFFIFKYNFLKYV